jgi:hypothetical protein
MPLDNRFIRVLTLAAMFGSSVILAGGTLVTTAAPSAAATGGTNVCSSAVGTGNALTGVQSETLSGCHQQGSATVDEVRAQNPLDELIAIHWATGNATSQAITHHTSFFSGGPCPAGDVGETGTVTVIEGPYAGSVGHLEICDDFSRFPTVTWTNVVPTVI